MENTTFVIATHNPNKVREFRRILEPMGISILTPSLTEAEETGETQTGPEITAPSAILMEASTGTTKDWPGSIPTSVETSTSLP